jgi:hypothetical protein
MMLFKARTAARNEFEAACKEQGVSPSELRLFMNKKRSFLSPFFWPEHKLTATASDMVHSIAPYMKDPLHGVKQAGQRLASLFSRSTPAGH